ncbi:MAG: hypothetical protein AAGI44_06930 [Pseudomonadota bacterium]
MIGICCVYLAESPTQLGILQTSLRQLRRTTHTPFKLYGAVPGANAQTLDILKDAEVRLVSANEKRITPGHLEHSVLLDELISFAIHDGCTHIATFDVDSWPIAPGWDKQLGELLTESAPLAAVVRTELGDNFPFPAFTYFLSSFWNHEQSRTGLLEETSWSEEAKVCSVRPAQTGSGLLAQLYDTRTDFFAMERTNAWSPHTVISAVYENTVFHLGALSRKPKFFSDREDYRLDGTPVKRRHATAMNAAIKDIATKEVLSNHDRWIHALTDGAKPISPRRVSPASFKDLGAKRRSDAKPEETSDKAVTRRLQNLFTGKGRKTR